MRFAYIASATALLATALLATALLSNGCVALQPLSSSRVRGDAAVEGIPARALADYLQHREATQDPVDIYRPWVAVLPVEDVSGFRAHVWDLANEMPRMLSAEMGRSTAWRVIPYAAVAEAVAERRPRWSDEDLRDIGTSLRADMLLAAVLLDYNMERLHVGDPLIGGYKSYKGVAELEAQVLRATDLTRVGAAHAQQEVIDRGLGLDLLGKPRKQDYQFSNLGEMAYGAEEFRGTAIGQATVMAMDEVIQEVARLIRPKAIQVATGAPEILSVFGAEVFINVGSENGVHEGYRFAVYPAMDRAASADPDQRIAVIEVRDIIGARVSKVEALYGGAELRVGDRLQLIVAEPE